MTVSYPPLDSAAMRAGAYCVLETHPADGDRSRRDRCQPGCRGGCHGVRRAEPIERVHCHHYTARCPRVLHARAWTCRFLPVGILSGNCREIPTGLAASRRARQSYCYPLPGVGSANVNSHYHYHAGHIYPEPTVTQSTTNLLRAFPRLQRVPDTAPVAIRTIDTPQATSRASPRVLCTS